MSEKGYGIYSSHKGSQIEAEDTLAMSAEICAKTILEVIKYKGYFDFKEFRLSDLISRMPINVDEIDMFFNIINRILNANGLNISDKNIALCKANIDLDITEKNKLFNSILNDAVYSSEIIQNEIVNYYINLIESEALNNPESLAIAIRGNSDGLEQFKWFDKLNCYVRLKDKFLEKFGKVPEELITKIYESLELAFASFEYNRSISIPHEYYEYFNRQILIPFYDTLKKLDLTNLVVCSNGIEMRNEDISLILSSSFICYKLHNESNLVLGANIYKSYDLVPDSGNVYLICDKKSLGENGKTESVTEEINLSQLDLNNDLLIR